MVSRVADDSAKSTDPSDGADKPAQTTQTKASASTSSKSASKSSSTRKTAAKTTSKSSNSKTSKPSTRSRKPSTPRKSRAAAIQEDLESLEKRLKRADGVTRKSVESLETVVSALEASLKKSNAAQKGRLTRHVNALTERLDQQTTDMRETVRKELKGALAEGSLSDLDSALGRASLRLDKAEIAQADAIARVNKHLADIARAVDARIKAESQSRREELDGLTETLTSAITQSKSDLETRVSAVEKDSADALTKVGDTIERIHQKLEQKRQASSDAVVEKVNELAVQTQAELDSYQTKLEARLEEVEARHLAVGTGTAERVVERAREEIRHRIDGLQARITELEQRPVATPAPQMAPLPPLPDTAITHMPGSPGPTGDLPSHDVPPNPIQTLRDRLTTFRGQAVADVSNPYATALQPSNDFESQIESVPAQDYSEGPVEFTPTLPETVMPPSPVLPFPGQTPHDSTPHTPDLPPFQMPNSLPPLTVENEFEPAPMPDSVYSNPAYAEDVNTQIGRMAHSASDSPMAIRVTDDSPQRRFSLPSLPKLSNRNLRLGLMVGAAIIVAVASIRIILGSTDGPGPQIGGETSSVVELEPEVGSIPLTSMPNGSEQVAGATDVNTPPDTSSEPIGNYEETQPVVIDTAQLDTLEAAVEAGNPIAQFQMGLAKLDAGQTDEGAALVRQAASANQPAALYRLAKLYEAGEGVPRDDVMARQLIERAARGGNRIAMHDLALYYTEGRGGVDLSMTTAKSWFEQAAERGVVDSQFNLAILSESSEIGTTPNIEDALFWYSIAARQGDQFAVSRRDALRETLSAGQLSDIDQRIADFSPRPIEEEANGIFNDVPWVSTAQAPTRTQIREAQTLLANLGYSVGTPDGLMGSRTRTAITQFERANGLSETGEVSSQLINRLANAAGT